MKLGRLLGTNLAALAMMSSFPVLNMPSWKDRRPKARYVPRSRIFYDPREARIALAVGLSKEPNPSRQVRRQIDRLYR